VIIHVQVAGHTRLFAESLGRSQELVEDGGDDAAVYAVGRALIGPAAFAGGVGAITLHPAVDGGRHCIPFGEALNVPDSGAVGRVRLSHPQDNASQSF